MTIELFLQTVVNATYAASYMALIAVGLVLIFGVMGVINFAHGELYMAGSLCRGRPLRRHGHSLLRRRGAWPHLRRAARTSHGIRPVQAVARQSARRADRLDRISPYLADDCRARLRRPDGASAAVDARQDRASPTAWCSPISGSTSSSPPSCCYGAVAVLAQEQVRLGAPRLRPGPRGGSPTGHVDQRHRAGSPCSSARLLPVLPAR